MEKRSGPRFAADESVVVTVLGEEELRWTAHVRNASARGLALELPQAVSPGTSLRIELEDSTIPGEAVYCQGEAGSYLIGVELDPTLCSLAQLGRRLEEREIPLESGGKMAYAVNHRQRQHRQQPQE
jgi:hypothetical protein